MRRAARFGLLVGGVVALLFGATTRVGWVILAPVLLSVADHSQPRARCDDWLGQLAAVVHGKGVEYREECAADALRGERTEVLLSRIARNPMRRAGARTAALRILSDGHAELVQVGEDVLNAPAEAPAFRRAAMRALAAGRGGTVWIEDPGRWPAHGGFDTAAFLHAAEGGDPRQAAAAWTVLRGDLDPADRGAALMSLGTSEEELRAAVTRTGAGLAPLGMPAAWRTVLATTGCDARCDGLVGLLLAVEARATPSTELSVAPALPGDDELVDLLYGPELGDHVRAEAAATLAWIASDSTLAVDRAFSAVASPLADPASVPMLQRRAGDLHAALRHGGGPSGAVAAALDLVGIGAGGVTAWVDPTGVTVEVGERRVTIGRCGAPVATGSLPSSSVAVPAHGIGALALVEAGGRALREGDPGRAGELAEAASARWEAAPGLVALRASATAAIAATHLSDAAVGDPRDSRRKQPGTDMRGRSGWVHPRGLHVAVSLGRSTLPPADLDPAVRGAKAELEIRGMATAPEPLILAAWWAAAYGDHELARLLVPGPLSGAYEDVRVATLLVVGEPTSAIGPLSRVVAGLDAGDVACPPAFSPWPGLPEPTPSR